jgi:transcriptional regulator with XRE-family HTH domain
MKGNRRGSFAEALKGRRKEIPWTQQELAQQAGISVQSIKAYETDAKRPSPASLRSIVDALRLEGVEREAFIALAQGLDNGAKQSSVRVEVAPDTSDALPQASVDSPHRAAPVVPPYRALLDRVADWGKPRKLPPLTGAVIAIAAVSLASLAVVLQVRAASYESNLSNTAAATFCPGTSALCQTTAGFVRGRVHMVCWQDAILTDGQAGRWFYIQAPNGAEGFVRAGTVADQITTPNCATISWIKVAAWALAQDGQTTISRDATNGNSATYWSSWCWLFVYDAWKLGAGFTPVHSASTAQQTWNLYKASGSWYAASSMPPRGSLVFFSSGSVGRVAVSLGNGWVETSQGGDESEKLPVTHMTLAQVGLPQMGYVPPSLV